MSQKHKQRTRAEKLARRNCEGLRITISKEVYRGLRSKHRPHVGLKEQERAARCYMSPTFNCSGNSRTSPVMHQISKERYDLTDSVF